MFLFQYWNSNPTRKNTNDMFVVPIGKLDNRYAKKKL